MATHSSILAWEIPWTEEPGELQSRGVTQSDTAEQLALPFFSPATYDRVRASISLFPTKSSSL